MSNDEPIDLREKVLTPPRSSDNPTGLKPPSHKQLHRLLVLGTLMANTLEGIADEIDETSGTNPDRPERVLSDTWHNLIEEMRP